MTKSVSPFNLEQSWNSQWIIGALRTEISTVIDELREQGGTPFDPQDLEHQALFYLTTYSPATITRAAIRDAVMQQHLLITERMRAAASPDVLCHLFRGLRGDSTDLNVNARLKMCLTADGLYATGDGIRIPVEFKKIHDEKLISLFTESMHYVHDARSNGDAFAYYFEGDAYPWAIETAENGALSRGRKRDALIGLGYDPARTVELTRLYMLPGSPRNAISLMDKLVAAHYEDRGYEAMFTCTMPSYSKTKSSTISGGMDEVLCTRDLSHSFALRTVDDVECWQQVTRRWLEETKYDGPLKKTHPSFSLLPVVDVYMPLRKSRAAQAVGVIAPMPQFVSAPAFA